MKTNVRNFNLARDIAIEKSDNLKEQRSMLIIFNEIIKSNLDNLWGENKRIAFSAITENKKQIVEISGTHKLFFNVEPANENTNENVLYSLNVHVKKITESIEEKSTKASERIQNCLDSFKTKNNPFLAKIYTTLLAYSRGEIDKNLNPTGKLQLSYLGNHFCAKTCPDLDKGSKKVFRYGAAYYVTRGSSRQVTFIAHTKNELIENLK